MILRRFLLVTFVIGGSHAFLTQPKRSTSVSMSLELPAFKFPNPFAKNEKSGSNLTPPSSNAFEPTPEGLIARAKAVLVADLGIQDPSQLASDFIWIGPQLGSQVLGKADYLAAGRFFDLRSAFPDLDYRAHDFRIDSRDAMTVRLTARTIGTMRGELRLRSGTLSPTGIPLMCPPEAISMTFSKDGKVTKLCSGFTMDRLVGNTGGLCGIMAAATVAGAPPNDWEIYPVPTVIERFIGRPVRQLSDVGSFLAPFPETIMIQLAKGIIAAKMASLDPDLLAPGFTYCGPYVGPVNKRNFLEKYAKALFGGVEPELTHFRVDPYDPYRVWVDVRPVGVIEGMQIDVSPQAMSFTFDDEGFCTRLTAGAVMDPSVGNSGGLGGLEGVKYAMGTPEPGIFTFPLPIFLSRLRKRVLEPITKIGVDEYTLAPSKLSLPATPPVGTIAPPSATAPAKDPENTLSETVKQSSPISALTEAVPMLSFLRLSNDSDGEMEGENREKAKEAATTKAQTEAVAKKAMDEEAAGKQAEMTMATNKAEFLRKQQFVESAPSEDERRQVEEAKKVKEAEKEKIAAEAKRQAEQVASAKKQAQAAEAKLQAEKLVAAKQQAAESKRLAEQVSATKKQAAEAAKVAEAKRQAEKAAVARKQEEDAKSKRRADEAAAMKRQAVENAKAAAVEAKRKATEAVAAKQAEAKRKAEESAAAKRQAVEDAKAAAAEAKRRTTAAAAAKRQAVEDAKAAAAEAKRKAEESAAVKREAAQVAKAAAVEAKRRAEDAAAANRQAALEAKAIATAKVAEAKRQAQDAAAAKRQSAVTAAAEAKRRAAEVAAAKQKQLEDAALARKQSQKSKAPALQSTVNLAPRGVPTLNRWKKNSDGTITGLITGSTIFDENEKVTTSAISKGEISAGEVVQTQSGSKYFLSYPKR